MTVQPTRSSVATASNAGYECGVVQAPRNGALPRSTTLQELFDQLAVFAQILVQEGPRG